MLKSGNGSWDGGIKVPCQLCVSSSTVARSAGAPAVALPELVSVVNVYTFSWFVCVACVVHFSRILSIACGPSTSTFAFAAAASSSSHHMGSSFLTSSLTSPGLPSSRVLTNEMTQFSRPGVMGRGSSSSLRKGELPTAGGVFIWDLKTQKQKVYI